MKLEFISSFMYNLVMSTLLERRLLNWQKPYIRDVDLLEIYGDKHQKRHDSVKYAIHDGILKPIRRGLYLITIKHEDPAYEPYEFAQAIYGPSYISLESALSYHGWIPEGVYTITSVSTRRSKTFQTPIGIYSYAHTPSHLFYQHVQRIELGHWVFLMAMPWKALADHIYVYKKNWQSLRQLYEDMRIEYEFVQQSDINTLEALSKDYKSVRVRKNLKKLLEELK